MSSDGAAGRGGAAIRIAGVSRCFGSVPAVDSVDLDVRPGEFLSLLGPSGSGKSTLLMMIAGFEMADAGSILLDGRDLTHVPPNRRDVGMVFQRYALFPHMSVAENVAFPLRIRKMARAEIETRVSRTLEMVRLGDLGSRSPAQLSGGQQQRVAVARALVFGPRVLLMDEPLGALDKKLREELQIEIKKLHDEVGVTIVYVTHDQEEALTMSDRIAVMRSGRIEQVDTPRALYDAPASPFVADFIGRMNFVAGELSTDGGHEVLFRVGQETVALPGATVRGPGARATRAGARLAVRPEHLELAEPGAPGTLGGTVDTSIFVGAFTTCLVRLDQGDIVHVQAPSRTQAVAGQRVAVRIASDAPILFRQET